MFCFSIFANRKSIKEGGITLFCFFSSKFVKRIFMKKKRKEKGAERRNKAKSREDVLIHTLQPQWRQESWKPFSLNLAVSCISEFSLKTLFLLVIVILTYSALRKLFKKREKYLHEEKKKSGRIKKKKKLRCWHKSLTF